MHKKGIIFIDDNKNSLNTKVRDKMEIHILNIEDNAVYHDDEIYYNQLG